MAVLRLMTYNVRYFGHGTRGITSTDVAMQRIAEAISVLDPLPGVIALQELDTHSLRADIGRSQARNERPQLLRLMEYLHQALAQKGLNRRYKASFYPGHDYRLSVKTSVYTTGLAILTSDEFFVERRHSFGARDITHRRFKLTSKMKQTRICVHLLLRHRESGGLIDVFNTHFSLPAFLTWRTLTLAKRMGYGPNQLEEARAVLDFIAQAQTQRDVVLMGDLNTLPGSPVYEMLTAPGGLEDPFVASNKFSVRELERFPTAGFMHLRMHLDYILSGAATDWIDFDGTLPFGEGPFHGLSDHMPLIGSLRLSLPEGGPQKGPLRRRLESV